MSPKYFLALLSGALPHLSALAHEGHGLQGSAHWHATDTLGFVGAGVAAVVVWVLIQRK